GSSAPKGGLWDTPLGAVGNAAGNIPITALGAAFGGAGAEAPKGKLSPEELVHPGTGPYPAHYTTDPSLPDKTIYAPMTPPPASVKMPVIVWGEGGCFKTGTFYAPFLIELASHGYVILANGPPTGSPPTTMADMGKLMQTPQTKVSDLLDSIDWVVKGGGKKFGSLDLERIATAGQSCGGTEALSAAYKNDKVKLTFLVNSGTLNAEARPWLREFKYPVGIFNGGPKDIAYANGVADYEVLQLPAFMANLDTGHGGTLFAKNGGKFGKAVSSFLEWTFRGDQKSKAICLDPKAPGSLVSENWNVSAKGW
ncbi:hypothetical protein EJ06DRAFT_461085, partial [Trichodelitschia bisporula]